jgi:hypothetical protein
MEDTVAGRQGNKRIKALATTPLGKAPFAKGANTLEHVRRALRKGGYGPAVEGITAAKFDEMTSSGQERHKIFFANRETGKQDSGNVFVNSKGEGAF